MTVCRLVDNKEVEEITKYVPTISIINIRELDEFALAAWRCGHRFRLRNRLPGFESRQCKIFLGKTYQYAIDLQNMHSLCIYVFRNKGIGHKNIFLEKSERSF
jgi:hypothetical protein